MAFKSSTGHTGIIKSERGFRAQTRFNKQVIELGTYPSIEEALIARAAAQRVVNKVAAMKGPAGSVLPCNAIYEHDEAAR